MKGLDVVSVVQTESKPRSSMVSPAARPLQRPPTGIRSARSHSRSVGATCTRRRSKAPRGHGNRTYVLYSDDALGQPPRGQDDDGQTETAVLPLFPARPSCGVSRPPIRGITFYEWREEHHQPRPRRPLRLQLDHQPLPGMQHACTYCLDGDTPILWPRGGRSPSPSSGPATRSTAPR